MSHSWEVQKAVYAALTGASAVTDIVTSSGVLDEICPTQAMPYINIGDDVESDWSTFEKSGFSITVTLHSWSDYKGRKQIKEIQKACYDALHRQTLTVTGFTFVECEYRSAQSFLDSDGTTRHGVQTFEILLHET